MKILFVQTAHKEHDDRVYWHQRAALESQGAEVVILSLYGVERKQAQQAIIRQVTDFQPDRIICDTPLAVLACRRAHTRARIYYDITEWYPSQIHLRHTPSWLRPLKAVLMRLVYRWAGWQSDRFIFGEESKAQTFRRLFPRKPSLLLPYYPDLQYIAPQPPNDLSKTLRLFYAGSISNPLKGIQNVLNAAQVLASRQPHLTVFLTIVKAEEDKDVSVPQNGLPANLKLIEKEAMPLPNFCKEITQHDFFFDLRTIDDESTHSLPIKLFYYLAAGRPVVYSDLEAIHSGLQELPAQMLVEPTDAEKIGTIIEGYLAHASAYQHACSEMRRLIEEKYNWGAQQQTFLHFILD